MEKNFVNHTSYQLFDELTTHVVSSQDQSSTYSIFPFPTSGGHTLIHQVVTDYTIRVNPKPIFIFENKFTDHYSVHLIKLTENIIVIGCHDIIRVIDVSQKKELMELKGPVTCLERITDTSFAVGSWNLTPIIRVWDILTGTSFELRGHSYPPTCIVRMSDDIVVTGTQDTMIRVWDFTKKESMELKGHLQPVMHITKLTDQVFITADQKKEVKVWKICSTHPKEVPDYYNVVCILELTIKSISCVTRLTDTLFITGTTQWGGNKLVQVWNTTGKLIINFEHPEGITNIKTLSPTTFATGSEDGTVTVCDVTDGSMKVGQTECRRMRENLCGITCVDKLADNLFVTGISDGLIQVWNCKEDLNDDPMVLKEHQDPNHYFTYSCVMRLTDTSFVTQSYDKTIVYSIYD